ncbi:MAG: hypothetical protein HYU66_23510 [Armatimonadetes bacterium]|nr:hypothetical protein [Armatimonadota bacterium]
MSALRLTVLFAAPAAMVCMWLSASLFRAVPLYVTHSLALLLGVLWIALLVVLAWECRRIGPDEMQRPQLNNRQRRRVREHLEDLIHHLQSLARRV